MMKEVGDYTVINADGLILGRLASKVARRLLCGEKIAVVNSEMTVISGKRSSIIEDYKEKLRIRTLVNPAKGPFHAETGQDSEEGNPGDATLGYYPRKRGVQASRHIHRHSTRTQR